MGGKSRKTGSISRGLIDRLKANSIAPAIKKKDQATPEKKENNSLLGGEEEE